MPTRRLANRSERGVPAGPCRAVPGQSAAEPKGGMLLAAYDARRPTADPDALARSIANGPDDIVTVVSEVAQII